jgi:hypothetical protein
MWFGRKLEELGQQGRYLTAEEGACSTTSVGSDAAQRTLRASWLREHDVKCLAIIFSTSGITSSLTCAAVHDGPTSCANTPSCQVQVPLTQVHLVVKERTVRKPCCEAIGPLLAVYGLVVADKGH